MEEEDTRTVAWAAKGEAAKGEATLGEIEWNGRDGRRETSTQYDKG